MGQENTYSFVNYSVRAMLGPCKRTCSPKPIKGEESNLLSKKERKEELKRAVIVMFL